MTFELIGNGIQPVQFYSLQVLIHFQRKILICDRKFYRRLELYYSYFSKDYVENVDKEIFSSRTFDAPRDLVWEVWTNPKHTALW